MDEVSEVVELATESNPHANAIFIVILVLVATVFVLENIKKFKEILGIRNKWELQDMEQSNKIQEIQKEVNDVGKEVDYIKDTQSTIKDVIDKLDKNITRMQQKQDAADRSRIKDRISQLYRYYKDRGSWTSMEQEAFNDLVTSYEAAGGLNSFIHEVVVPASLTWKVVDQ